MFKILEKNKYTGSFPFGNCCTCNGTARSNSGSNGVSRLCTSLPGRLMRRQPAQSPPWDSTATGAILRIRVQHRNPEISPTDLIAEWFIHGNIWEISPPKKRKKHVANCMIWIMHELNFFYLHRLHRNQPSPTHLQSQISPFLVILEVTQIVPRFLWVFHQCSHSVEPFHGVCFSDGLAWQNFWEIFSPPGNPVIPDFFP